MPTIIDSISSEKQLRAGDALSEIVEGTTRLIVPSGSVTETVPPKEPAFFNPRAEMNRDMSLIAYGSFLKSFVGPKIFLDGLAGIGARGIRVANELDVDGVVVNDLNPSAIRLARDSAVLNNVRNVEFSENEVCRFFSMRSEGSRRGAIVDVDPFGSPTAFFDCCLRATMHGGMLSCTATDLQVLNGLFQDACRRKYGGIPTRVKYGNEVAIRLILGCLRTVAGRLGMKIRPLFVEADMHYYRTYVRVMNRPDTEECLGFILHCDGCGQRKASLQQETECTVCGSEITAAGPLWIGRLFEREFVEDMDRTRPRLKVDKRCANILARAALESEMPAAYYTTDEIASKTGSSPPKMDDIIRMLQEDGFLASPTTLNPTGFRTDATVVQIKRYF